MCRIAAYLGPAVPLSRLLFEPSHALEMQARRPREMVHGTINVDGTGVVWWPDGEAEPLRYATVRPPWSDANLARLAPRLYGETIVASVRSARHGTPAGSAAVLPFELDGIAGAHNGFLERFREATAARCLAKLPEELVGEFESMSDSLAVFLLAVAALREDPDLSLLDALGVAVGTAARVCQEADAPCSLNLVLATRNEIAASRFARGVEANTLYVRSADRAEEGAYLASEPLDDRNDWREVPEDHGVRITCNAADIIPLRIEL